jgi:hypothetical protein
MYPMIKKIAKESGKDKIPRPIGRIACALDILRGYSQSIIFLYKKPRTMITHDGINES